MPTLDQIRKDKYAKLVEKFKEKEKLKILKQSQNAKIDFVLKKLLEPDALEYFLSLRETDLNTYINIGINLIKNYNLVPPYLDYIIEDLVQGRTPKTISKDSIIRMERKIRNVEAQIKVIHQGETKNLSEVLTGKPPKESSGDDKGGTVGKDRRDDDKDLGETP